MECRDVRPLADAFVSEQLLVETMEGVVAHLARCPACRAEVDGLRRLRVATRSAFANAPHLDARPEFLSSLRTRLQADAARRAPAGFTRRAWLASAAGVAMAVAAGAAWRQWVARSLTSLMHAAVDDHRFCPRQLSEAPITLAEAARRYDAALAALQTVEPAVTALDGSALRIVERHSCAFNGERFAHLALRYKDQLVSLLVGEAAESEPGVWHLGPADDGTVSSWPATDGLHVAAFRGSRHVAFVVSALDQTDVEAVGRAMAGPVTRALAQA